MGQRTPGMALRAPQNMSLRSSYILRMSSISRSQLKTSTAPACIKPLMQERLCW